MTQGPESTTSRKDILPRWKGVLSFIGAAAVILAACGGSSTPTSPAPDAGATPTTTTGWIEPSLPPGLSAALTGMLQQLTTYLGTALDRNQQLIPTNPQLTSQLQAKIAILQNRSLAQEIVDGRRWVESQTASIDGRTIPIVAVFAVDGMRGEGTQTVRNLEPVLPLLERFYNVPLNMGVIRLWYGFVLGNSGGGGTIYSEDRTSYEARLGPTGLPYDAMLGHELGHSFMAHESLDQFLELYVYNMVRGGSTDPATWTYTRGWVPGRSSNTGVAALMDIYQLIGLDTMMKAYRAIYPLHPSYGAVLSASVIQTFVEQVPASMQAAVNAKLSAVGY